MKKVIIGREAYDKIQYYVNKTNFEISGFGDVEIVDGVAVVTDIILLKQENHSTETEIDADAISKAIYDHHINPNMKGELKFWWHSHVNMGCFWSSTDRATMKQLTENGWWIHGVFNKKNEYKLCYTNKEPFPVEFDDLDLEIDESLVYNTKLVDINLKILEKEAQIEKMFEEIKEIEKETQGVLDDELDAQYKELVTEKTYKSMYYDYDTNNPFMKKYNASKSFREKQLAILEKQSLSASETIGDQLNVMADTIKKYTQFENVSDYFHKCDFYDPEGALELFQLGYTEDEINYLGDYCWVYDAEGLYEYEAEYGNVKPMLQDDIKTTYNY